MTQYPSRAISDKHAEAHSAPPLLRYASVDPEARLSLPSGSFTTPALSSSLLGAIALMLGTYVPSFIIRNSEIGQVLWKYLTAFDRIPILIMFFSCWSVSTLYSFLHFVYTSTQSKYNLNF